MKITKLTLKKLIKEELESVLSEDSTLNENLASMWQSISRLLVAQGFALHNPHQWLKDGLESGVVSRRASPADIDVLPTD